MFIRQSFFLLLFWLLSSSFLTAQEEKLTILQPAESFNKTRFWALTGSGIAGYTGAVLVLNNIWYAGYDRSAFHFFDDSGEWEYMDKAGHFFTAYVESNWAFQAYRWTGMKRRNAMWTAVGIGSLFQATIEVLDGFSTKWGFSSYDIAFNTMGCALFLSQELAWQEQRIIMKVSASHPPYPETPITSSSGTKTTTLKTRADELYGGSFPASFLKDYNAQTIWLSANIHSFLKKEDSRFPKWLNLAVGYGADNMFGGYENQWPFDEPIYFLDNNAFPRYKQFYFSFDIDLTRIPAKRPFVRTLFRVLNFIKIPSPTLEFNTIGKHKMHWMFF